MIFHASDFESGSTSWTRLLRESMHNQEYRLRQVKNIVSYFAEIDPESWRRNIWEIYDWMENNFMVENDFAAWQSDRAVESKETFILILCFVLVKFINILSLYNTGKEQLNVYEYSWISWIECNRPRVSRVGVEYFPGHTILETTSWDRQENDREQDQSWTVWRSNHLHVDVQRHRLDKKKKPQKYVYRIL